MPDEAMPSGKSKNDRAKVGRPKKYAEPPERRTATLPSAYTTLLEEVGQGSLSAGIRAIVDTALGEELNALSQATKHMLDVSPFEVASRALVDEAQQSVLARYLTENATAAELAHQVDEASAFGATAKLLGEAAARHWDAVADVVKGSEFQETLSAVMGSAMDHDSVLSQMEWKNPLAALAAQEPAWLQVERAMKDQLAPLHDAVEQYQNIMKDLPTALESWRQTVQAIEPLRDVMQQQANILRHEQQVLYLHRGIDAPRLRDEPPAEFFLPVQDQKSAPLMAEDVRALRSEIAALRRELAEQRVKDESTGNAAPAKE